MLHAFNIDATHSIQSQVQARNLPFLLHFTNVLNLPGILAGGLLTRAYLEQHETGFESFGNDSLRLDQRKGSVSLSISHPNERMFYKYRMLSPDVQWAVLAISPAVLWEKCCAFFPTNAANAAMRQRPLWKLSGPDAFAALFGDEEKRRQQQLPPCETTDVQAEVLVLEAVEPAYIHAIFFADANTLQAQAKLLTQHGTPGLVFDPVFQKRSWQKN